MNAELTMRPEAVYFKVTVTGHRPDKIFGGYNYPNKKYDKIYAKTKLALYTLMPDFVYTGMALGFDQLVCEVCLELKIPYIACVPFKGQELAWPTSSQQKYKTLIDKAFEVVVVSEGGYSAEKMQIRNEYMVDHCDLLLACYNGDKSGGTYNCVEYARKLKRDMIIIKP